MISFAGLHLILSNEKSARTHAQKKLDSQLLYALSQQRGNAGSADVPTQKINLKRDKEGRVLIDVRVKVDKEILASIESLGGKIVSTSARYNSILAYVHLEKIERLANLESVLFIGPAAEAVANK
jgi:hypothetical protein